MFSWAMTIYNSSKPINWAVFSKAKPLRSPRLVQLTSFKFDQKRCNTSKSFRPFFVYCIWSTIDSFFSVFSIAAFLSFTAFSSDSQLCVVGFNKIIILLGLVRYEMIITNSALRASLVIYPFILARPHRIIAIYIYIYIYIKIMIPKLNMCELKRGGKASRNQPNFKGKVHCWIASKDSWHLKLIKISTESTFLTPPETRIKSQITNYINIVYCLKDN